MTILPPLSVTFPNGPGSSTELFNDLQSFQPHPPTIPPPALPPKPSQNQSQIIGMRFEQGTSKMHGRFAVPPIPLIWCKSPQAQKDGKYFLNASCSLVMEQLPKTHRTLDFVRSWAKTASKSDPAYISIDPSKAKALVEFSSVTSAQAAWSSPRLGSELATLKSLQLKGRPRLDLIRVWWYRPDPTDTDTAELEEGEIASEEVVLIEEKSKIASNPTIPKCIPKEPRAHPKPPPNAPTAPRNHPLSRESSYPVRTLSSGSTPSQSTMPSPSTTVTNSIPEVYSAVSLTPPITPVLSALEYPAPREIGPIGRSHNTNISAQDAPTPSDSTLSPSQSVMEMKPPTPKPEFDRPDPHILLNVTMHPQSPTPSLVESPLDPPQSKPKAHPSYTKEFLQARQKELETKIAQSKMELQSMQTKTIQPKAPSPPTVSSANRDASVVSTVLEKESRLRELVVKSQRKKIHSPATDSAAPLEVTPLAPPPDSRAAESLKSTTTSSVSSFASTTTTFSLEDMAISFISETIETVKLNQRIAPPPPKPLPIPTVKEELGLKQRRLEEHIAESKVLMAKLTQARTKEEKNQILATLREKSRMMEEANKASDVRIEAAKANQPQPPSKKISVPRWPSLCQSTSIFTISDDESDEDD
ncbi:hypothetical protein BDN72DRAFT_834775 [Pluteus cervinus]|uniref:Uncharacterized protein n=1 Tax=Pluteus cervinus TaxID=181527 RepID=A0ACD3B6G5_9AGAR|nr:hypothetical protein BDN72DRAFT_834775 [Pluteus cervinus]